MKKNEYRKNSIFAFLGSIGAVFFMVGDCLLYCKSGLSNSSVEPLWADMSEQRFVISAVLGFIGMSLMLPACVSFYRMTAEVCGKVVRVLINIGFIGVASTGYLHFALGSLLPISYKTVIDNGGSPELAEKLCLHWAEIVAPINMALIVCLFMIYAIHFYVTVSGQSGMNRLTCIVGIIGAFAIGMIWKLIFGSTAVGGAYGAFESLGEGLTFLTVLLYWRKKVANGLSQ